jgi:predicted ATP-grasp superfamily ATP-dependent carboligase
VVAFDRRDICHYSRLFPVIDCPAPAGPQLIEWLLQERSAFDTAPFLIGCSDAMALCIAQHQDVLSPAYRISRTPYEKLVKIVSKDELYEEARSNGLLTPPPLASPTVAKLMEWALTTTGKFLVKPYYTAHAGSSMTAKNLAFESCNSLHKFVDQVGTDCLLIQELLEGGDNCIFDCYGFCDQSGRIITSATHRRIRQSPPDLGVTSYGEIPATDTPFDPQQLHDNTQRLIDGLDFNGIFGVEWLYESSSGRLFLLDFNARPFSSIGHLADCGLNLPAIAYRDAMGIDQNVERYPPLQRKLWINLGQDAMKLPERLARKQIGLFSWLVSVFAARSYALFRWSDPVPALVALCRTFLNGVQGIGRRIRRRFSHRRHGSLGLESEMHGGSKQKN